MYFETLQVRLLDCVRRRVQNGEVTERRLAGMSGISQPHIHNLLKGARGLSPAIADRILRTLEMSVFDLLTPEEGGPWGHAAQHPCWLNRGARGPAPPHGRSLEPAWPSETN